jgi:hypothetical protein
MQLARLAALAAVRFSSEENKFHYVAAKEAAPESNSPASLRSLLCDFQRSAE